MPSFIRFLGSLVLAVALLLIMAMVLAWGTLYEARFGTAAVQRFVYHAWWFQGLLAFLAVNLAAAAAQRWPWQRRHTPFLLAHLGIIMLLIGGILGGRFGIEGQLLIPEGETARMLRLPGDALVVSEPNPGTPHVFPTSFETTAWRHKPHTLFHVPLERRAVDLIVDRYYPNAAVEESITADGAEDNPAVRLVLTRGDAAEEDVWLLARDPERFAARWGELQVFFVEAETEARLAQWLAGPRDAGTDRGVLTIEFPELHVQRDIPVPPAADQTVAIAGTPYQLTFKTVFTNLVITEHGVVDRPGPTMNPAVAVVLSGPEGTEPHLVFARHPEFDQVHVRSYAIPARLRYRASEASALPPHALGIIRRPTGGLLAVMTGDPGEQEVTAISVGAACVHPWIRGVQVTVAESVARARRTQQFSNRDDEVKAAALHVTAREGTQTAEGWVQEGGSLELPLGVEPVIVEYRPLQRELPVAITLRQFRKIEYPGIQMAAGFESDIELTDAARGVTVTRTIRMNQPLKYRGYTFFQASYIPGTPATTVLAVRNDPGTPLVYTGFLIVIAGVVSLFVLRTRSTTDGVTA